jgi:hypothetical protein
MANEITLTSAEQYRPAMPSYAFARFQDPGRASKISPWRSSVSNTVWQENNGTAGPDQDGAPAMIPCQP